MSMLDLAAWLGPAAEAISPQDSWQQRLGQTAGDMAGQEQDRRFLADLLSGMPDPSGRHGLSPEVVLQGMNLRHQIEQSRPQPVEMAEVDTPFGTQQMPAEDVADYQRKVWAEQHSADPTAVREFEWVASQPEEVQKSYMEFIEQRNPSMAKEFAQILAEQEKQQRQRARVDKEMETKHELLTPAHRDQIHKRLEDRDVQRVYSENTKERVDRGMDPLPEPMFRELFELQQMAREYEDRSDEFSKVMFRPGTPYREEGFYGTTKDGREVLIRRHQRRSR